MAVLIKKEYFYGYYKGINLASTERGDGGFRGTGK